MSVQERTHYEVLELLPTASDAIIRSAYRTKCKTLHPDRGGDPAEMAAVNHAYATLSNPEQRLTYDADLADTLTGPPSSSGATSTTPAEPDAAPFINEDIANFAAAYEAAATQAPTNSAEIPDEAIPTLSFWGFLGFGAVLLALSSAWVVAILVIAILHHSGGTAIALNGVLAVLAVACAGACLWKRIVDATRRAHIAYAVIGIAVLLWGLTDRTHPSGWLMIAWGVSYFLTAETGRHIERASGWVGLFARGR